LLDTVTFKEGDCYANSITIPAKNIALDGTTSEI